MIHRLPGMDRIARPDQVLLPVGLLALCPLVAGAPTLLTATWIALCFLASLILVSVTLAGLGRSVAAEFRVLMTLLVSGIWVTLLDLALQAAAYPLSLALDIYLPLLAANSLVLTAGEQSLRGSGCADSLRRAIRQGVHAACWIIPIGLLREMLGTGHILSDSGLMPGLPGPVHVLPVEIPALASPSWALLILALVAAAAGSMVARSAPGT
ncbi:MAG: hypothetical protein HYR49_11920 [Gammaproteobacteria bacterium]|nr:hypothetical protein [Gammaproteobacteria bacterium]